MRTVLNIELGSSLLLIAKELVLLGKIKQVGGALHQILT